MKKFILLNLIFFCIVSINATAFNEQKNLNLSLSKDCTNLTCVRQNIDLIDSEIVKLIGLRLTYVKRAGELKQGNQPVHNQAREDQILANVVKLAKKYGYPSFIAAEIYKTILIQTNLYEKSGQKVVK